MSSNRARITLTPTHGTAEVVMVPTALPKRKAEQEVFWVSALIEKLGLVGDVRDVLTNPDDSHGGHDVVIHLREGGIIGVQVTELTYEL